MQGACAAAYVLMVQVMCCCTQSQTLFWEPSACQTLVSM